MASQLGIVPTWPNLQTIRLAIESEASYYDAALTEVAEMFIQAAKEWTAEYSQYRPLSEWKMRELSRLNSVDRFWFEDRRWRSKFAFDEFEKRHREQRAC